MNKSEFPILDYQSNSKLVSQVLNSLNQEIIASPKWVFVKSLSFVTRGLDMGYLHPEGLSSLRKYAQCPVVAQNNKEKIYISRIGTRRSIRGEELIAEHLANQGFRILRAENLAFKAQIELFLNAETLIGIHGAGLTNGIWTPQAKLIELMPSDRINRCFEWQSNLLESAYERILFNPEKPDIESIIMKLDSLIH
jgi:capsular polysaccharide biosynthesis protein